MDRPYIVKWKEGSITLHASSAKEAKAIAAEYLQAEILETSGDEDVPHPIFSPLGG